MMVDFRPDHDQETKEFKAIYKSRNPRQIYSAWPTWLKNLTKVFVAVLIIVLLVIAGRSIHHNFASGSDNPTGAGTQSPPTIPRQESADSRPNPPKKPASGSNKPSANSPNSQAATQLPNSGPGDIAGLFAGASALGATGHYFISRRRN